MARHAKLRAVLTLALLGVLCVAQEIETNCAADEVCGDAEKQAPSTTIDTPSIDSATMRGDASSFDTTTDSDQVPPLSDLAADDTPTHGTAGDTENESTDEELSPDTADHPKKASPELVKQSEGEEKLEEKDAAAANVRVETSESFPETCQSPGTEPGPDTDTGDPWLPPWIHRRYTQAFGGVVNAKNDAVGVFREGLQKVGALETFDKLNSQIYALAAPYGQSVADLYNMSTEKWSTARHNFVTLYLEIKKSMKRRHEQKRAVLEKERQTKIDRGEPVDEVLQFSDDYWKRQGQRSGVLFNDFTTLVGMGWRHVTYVSGDVNGKVTESFATTKTSVNNRLAPAVAKARVELGRRAKPIAKELLTKYPHEATTVAIKASKALGWLGLGTYKLTQLTDLGDSKTTPSKQLIDDAALLLGDCFGLAVVFLGVVSVSYFVIFRTRPGDSIPDECTFKIKHVPSNDGSFLGNAVGGGVDVRVLLPGVKKAAECDILVSDEQIKVSAMDGYHGVTIGIPPEAKGSSWVNGKDQWVMKAKFDLKSETLTICLRTPAGVIAKGASSPLGDENGNSGYVLRVSQIPDDCFTEAGDC